MTDLMRAIRALPSAILSLTALTALFLSPANAQTVAGTASPTSGYLYVNGPAVSGPGTYRYSFQFSRPATFGDLWVQYGYVYDVYDINGAYSYGNDLYLEKQYSFANPVRSGTALFTLPANYQIDAPGGGTEIGRYFGLGSFIEFIFPSDDPVSYSVSVGMVPEPATWAMMIMGFAAIGAAMRHQRRNRGVTAQA
ncbi:MAG: PEPxxWA-CTERM sorting domain-containing protein [Sphingobium sp.]